MLQTGYVTVGRNGNGAAPAEAPFVRSKWFADERPGTVEVRDPEELVKALSLFITTDGKGSPVPYIDDVTEETTEIRQAYEKMLADPIVWGVLVGQILDVASRKPTYIKGGDTDVDGEIAKFVEYSIEEVGGIPNVVWGICHAVWGAHSVSEKVWAVEDSAKYGVKHVLTALKPKRIQEAVELQQDEFGNVTGVKALLNAGQPVLDPNDFVIWAHLPLYANPRGTSALRAAYRPWFILQAAWRFRAIGLEKFLQPYLVGKYPTGQMDTRQVVTEALKKARGGTYAVIPDSVVLDVINLAGKGDTDFKSACDDLKAEIVFAITGATLQALEGQHQARAAASIHRETADLRVWFITREIPRIVNNQLIPDIVDRNYVLPEGSDYPTLTLETRNTDDLIERADLLLKFLPHVTASQAAIREEFGIPAPDPDIEGDEVGGKGSQPQPGGSPFGGSPFGFSEPQEFFEHDSENALRRYLEVHPGAEPSRHWVKTGETKIIEGEVPNPEMIADYTSRSGSKVEIKATADDVGRVEVDVTVNGKFVGTANPEGIQEIPKRVVNGVEVVGKVTAIHMGKVVQLGMEEAPFRALKQKLDDFKSRAEKAPAALKAKEGRSALRTREDLVSKIGGIREDYKRRSERAWEKGSAEETFKLRQEGERERQKAKDALEAFDKEHPDLKRKNFSDGSEVVEDEDVSAIALCGSPFGFSEPQEFFEHDSQEALDKYIGEHPMADRARHWVKEQLGKEHETDRVSQRDVERATGIHEQHKKSAEMAAKMGMVREVPSVETIANHFRLGRKYQVNPDRIKLGAPEEEFAKKGKAVHRMRAKGAGARALANKYGKDAAERILAEKTGRHISINMAEDDNASEIALCGSQLFLNGRPTSPEAVMHVAEFARRAKEGTANPFAFAEGEGVPCGDSFIAADKECQIGAGGGISQKAPLDAKQKINAFYKAKVAPMPKRVMLREQFEALPAKAEYVPGDEVLLWKGDKMHIEDAIIESGKDWGDGLGIQYSLISRGMDGRIRSPGGKTARAIRPKPEA